LPLALQQELLGVLAQQHWVQGRHQLHLQILAAQQLLLLLMLLLLQLFLLLMLLLLPLARHF
jgi:hypothetical protein